MLIRTNASYVRVNQHFIQKLLINQKMAKPIKETPILKGKDAVNFSQKMKEAENKKVSAQRLSEIKKNAMCLQSAF